MFCFIYSMYTNVPMPFKLQEHEARLLGIDPTNWLRVMLELEYPIILDFHGCHVRVVKLFHSRSPNALISNIGPASWDIWYSGHKFNNQDAWCYMELCNQSHQFRLTEDRDFIIHELGLPFEK